MPATTSRQTRDIDLASPLDQWAGRGAVPGSPEPLANLGHGRPVVLSRLPSSVSCLFFVREDVHRGQEVVEGSGLLVGDVGLLGTLEHYQQR